MFGQQTKPRRMSPIWKVIPVALIVFGGIVGIMVYLSQADRRSPVELTDILHEGDPDYDWYRKYVALEDPRIEMGLNFAGNRIVKFAGVINNGGERALDVVEVKLSFFNYDKPVWETTRTPVQPGPYTPPIRPLTERAFAFYFEEIPKGWKASHAEMAIEGFRFSGGH